jgi:hypothetical protein
MIRHISFFICFCPLSVVISEDPQAAADPAVSCISLQNSMIPAAKGAGG